MTVVEIEPDFDHDATYIDSNTRIDNVFFTVTVYNS